MNQTRCRGRARWKRLAAYGLLLWLTLAIVGPVERACASTPPSSEPSAAAPADEDGFFLLVLKNLFNSRQLMEILGRPQYTVLAFVALNLIVFTETGLLFGFFLPGDSLLVTAGVVCAAAGWNLPLLLVTLCASAIIGDSVGYAIGWRAGPKIFNREKSWLFKREHLLKAQEFYEKHGGKTIVLARFMPLIRTFAPVVAGVGKMRYRSFLFFNVFGGVGWVVSMILIGFFLKAIINPTLQPLFGPQFDVQDHIEKVVILVVLLSISPGIVVWLRSKFKGRAAKAEAETVRLHTGEREGADTRSEHAA
jgi:membrane-associated protein